MKIYNWIDVLADNENAERIFNEKGFGLRDLRKLPKYNFLRTNFSKEEVLFFVEDLFGKSKYLDSKLKFSSSKEKIPEEISQYLGLEFENYYGNNTSIPLEMNMAKEDSIKILKSWFDFDILRSTDHLDGDYGDYGTLSFEQFFIYDKEAFNYFEVSENRKNLCKKDDWDLSGRGYSKINLILPIDEIAEPLNSLVNKIEKQNKLRELEEITGKSIQELREIIE